MVFILKCLFHRRKFFKYTILQKDWIMYIKIHIFELLIFSQKEIFFLSFCRSNLCNVSTSCFHFERFISQKRLCLIDSSTDGFHPLYRNKIFLIIDIFKERNHFLRKKLISCLHKNAGFILEIYFAEENSSDWHLRRRILSRTWKWNML